MVRARDGVQAACEGSADDCRDQVHLGALGPQFAPHCVVTWAAMTQIQRRLCGRHKRIARSQEGEQPGDPHETSPHSHRSARSVHFILTN